MKTIYLFITILIGISVVYCAGINTASAEIVTAKSMRAVKTKVELLVKKFPASEILVIFDIDMTLTYPDHPALHYQNIVKYKDIYQQLRAELSGAEKDLLSTMIVEDYPQRLVEKETPHIIKSLQKKGVKTIALTASLVVAPSGGERKLIFVRRDNLQKIGIDFTKAYPGMLVSPFFQFPRYLGDRPTFYHGVISTNGEHSGASKGAVLAVLFAHGVKGSTALSYVPKCVVMVDDKRKNLEDVQNQLKSSNPNITFIGVEYLGAFACKTKDINADDFSNFWVKIINKAKNMKY